jgi:SAM-dependent methyltransferase
MKTIKPNLTEKHLDIGCGDVPRNPYHKGLVFGIDTRDAQTLQLPPGITYKCVNFVTDKLPFPDDYFDSISAYDVLEHIPRQILKSANTVTYPFIEIMNEIHRILKPGGIFLSTTPGYPRAEAFQDPTHVNFITLKTVDYFCGESPLGRMYGFNGKFKILINKFCIRNNYYDRNTSTLSLLKRRWHRKVFKGGWAHIIWELEAIK